MFFILTWQICSWRPLVKCFLIQEKSIVDTNNNERNILLIWLSAWGPFDCASKGHECRTGTSVFDMSLYSCPHESKCLKSAECCSLTLKVIWTLFHPILCHILACYGCNKTLTLQKQTSGNWKHSHSFIFETFRALWSVRPSAPRVPRRN